MPTLVHNVNQSTTQVKKKVDKAATLTILLFGTFQILGDTMTVKTRTTTEKKTAKKPTAKKSDAPKPQKASKPPAAADAPKAVETPKTSITHEMIAKRAYEIWLAAGRPHGQDHAIWLRAEAELRKASATSR